jgi:hypothetical protein
MDVILQTGSAVIQDFKVIPVIKKIRMLKTAQPGESLMLESSSPPTTPPTVQDADSQDDAPVKAPRQQKRKDQKKNWFELIGESTGQQLETTQQRK